jgi:hypothetical protein
VPVRPPEIVCIGWGSLLWRPAELPLAGRWRPDGPELPVEFARQARDDRITLVIVEGGARCRTYWAPLAVGCLAAAKRALADREGCDPRWIAVWPAGRSRRGSRHWTPGPLPPGFRAVEQWARNLLLDGAVWTGLPIGLRGARGETPSATEVVDYLARLSGETRRRAEEYIRRAPAQTRTPYRRRIEEALGWYATGGEGGPRQRT